MKLSLRILALFLLIQQSPVLKADNVCWLRLRFYKPNCTELIKTCVSKTDTHNYSVAVPSLAGNGKIADINHQNLTIRTYVFNKQHTTLITDIEDVDEQYRVIHFMQLLQKHQKIAFINRINNPEISNSIIQPGLMKSGIYINQI